MLGTPQHQVTTILFPIRTAVLGRSPVRIKSCFLVFIFTRLGYFPTKSTNTYQRQPVADQPASAMVEEALTTRPILKTQQYYVWYVCMYIYMYTYDIWYNTIHVYQWEFQDSKMEVLYNIVPYFAGNFLYIGHNLGLKYRPYIDQYLWFRYRPGMFPQFI